MPLRFLHKGTVHRQINLKQKKKKVVYVCFCHNIDNFEHLHLKPISHTPNGLDVLGLGGVSFNLLTNLLNVYGYGSDITDGIHIPNFAEQFFLGVYVVRVLCKEG